MIEGQMSIFDFIQQEERSLEEIPIEEAVKILERDTGIKFVWNSFYGQHIGRLGGQKIYVRYGRFAPGVFNQEKFIGIDIENDSHCGAGSPCTSIEEAVSFIEKHVRREQK